MAAPTFENIQLDIDNHIATITMNRPQALNALNEATLQELKQAVEYISSCAPAKGGDADVRVVILTGSGSKAFIAGADIKEMAAKSTGEAIAFAKLGQGVTEAIEKLPQPVIAAVNGFALGGGCEFAIACDFILGSENAVLGQPEVSLGITPGFGGCVRLAKFVGLPRARELIYTGRKVKAQEALAMGLLLEVVPLENLLPRAQEVARAIIAQSPLAVATCKSVINASQHVSTAQGLANEASAFGNLFDSHDQKEGMTAFVEKRKPEFKGE